MGWTPGVTVERGSHGRLNSLSETRELESENYQTKPDRPTGIYQSIGRYGMGMKISG